MNTIIYLTYKLHLNYGSVKVTTFLLPCMFANFKYQRLTLRPMPPYCQFKFTLKATNYFSFGGYFLQILVSQNLRFIVVQLKFREFLCAYM